MLVAPQGISTSSEVPSANPPSVVLSPANFSDSFGSYFLTSSHKLLAISFDGSSLLPFCVLPFPPCVYCPLLKFLHSPSRKHRALHKSRFPTRDDLEAFEESKAFVQEPDGPSSSSHISQVLHYGEFTLSKELYDLLVVYASSHMVFRDVPCADHSPAE